MNNLQQLIIIALQKDGATSGYDLTKKLKSLTGHSHQQVYRELKALLELNMVTVEEVAQEGKPDLKLYSPLVQFKKIYPLLIPSDFCKNTGVYSLASYDIINGTNLTQDYLAAAKSLEQTFLSKMK